MGKGGRRTTRSPPCLALYLWVPSSCAWECEGGVCVYSDGGQHRLAKHVDFAFGGCPHGHVSGMKESCQCAGAKEHYAVRCATGLMSRVSQSILNSTSQIPNTRK